MVNVFCQAFFHDIIIYIPSPITSSIDKNILIQYVEELQDKLFAIVRDTGGVVEPSWKG